jgi:hypothetical protein
MNIERAQVGKAIWLWWVLVSTLGFLIGGTVGTALGGALFSAEGNVVALAVAFAVTGAGTGTAQWLVLRQHLARAGWWILATAICFALFGVVDGADAVRFAAIFVVVGAVVGVAQWLVLRQHLSQAGWWVMASTLSFALFGVAPSVFEAVFGTIGFVVGVVVVLTIVSMYGGITGAVLVWLLRQPISP